MRGHFALGSSDLTEHLTTDRSLEIAGAASARAAADIVLDGRKTLAELAETLASEIVKRARRESRPSP